MSLHHGSGLLHWLMLVGTIGVRGPYLWAPRTRYAFDVNNKMFTSDDLDWFENRIGRFLPSPDSLGIPPITGRLGCSLEGAGKRCEAFAIGNYMNQELLRPIHKWLAAVLRRLPQDGTFNQTGPLKGLVGSLECFSYDLTAATYLEYKGA